MFDGLAAEIDALEVPLDRDALVELYGLRDRLDAKLLVAVGDFDRAELWDLDGDTSMANWLRHQTGRDTTAASREAGRGRKLGALPVLRQAFLDGLVTGGQVEVVLANVPIRHLDLFASHEAGLIDALAGLGTDELRTAMVDWRAKADATTDGDPPAERDSEVFLSTTIDGRGELRGSLNADLTALVDAAFRVADGKDFTLTPAERRADAFETIVRHFLDHQQTHTGGRHRPHVNVAVTYQEFLDGIGGTYPDTGGIPSPAELGATLCDCATHRLLVSGRSAILAYGRAKRLVPADLFQALMAATAAAGSPAAPAPPPKPTPTTSSSGATAAPRPSSTSSCSAEGTTGGSTAPATTPSSCPTAPSKSPTQTSTSNRQSPPGPSRRPSDDDSAAADDACRTHPATCRTPPPPRPGAAIGAFPTGCPGSPRPPEWRRMTASFDRASWDERWAAALREHGDQLGQRPPNAYVTDIVADQAPGRALDAGCGHGAEALWLAVRGWQVTAVDFAVAALEHGRQTAAALGRVVSERIEWVEADLGTWTPPAAAFDLVSSLYVHVAGPVEAMVARLAGGVAPGGTLLLVGHLAIDPETGADSPAAGQNQVTVEAAVAALEPAHWELSVAEERRRAAARTGVDAVICARRRA